MQGVPSLRHRKHTGCWRPHFKCAFYVHSINHENAEQYSSALATVTLHCTHARTGVGDHTGTGFASRKGFMLFKLIYNKPEFLCLVLARCSTPLCLAAVKAFPYLLPPSPLTNPQICSVSWFALSTPFHLFPYYAIPSVQLFPASHTDTRRRAAITLPFCWHSLP